MTVPDYITQNGLYYDYEKQWGVKNPDFTIWANKDKSEIIAIADIKDYAHSKSDLSQLKAGKMVSHTYDPHNRIRIKIDSAKKQFKACKDYPCFVVLGSSGGLLPPSGMFMIGAMLGDWTINIPVPNSNNDKMMPELTYSFGRNGKMVDPAGNTRNSTITAICRVETIFPDQKLSGYEFDLKQLVNKFYWPDDRHWIEFKKEVNQIKTELTKQGYNLDRQDPLIEYVINPFAKHQFPREKLLKGCLKIWEYDLDRHYYDCTYDWELVHQGKPL